MAILLFSGHPTATWWPTIRTTLKEAWSFSLGTPITAPPMTYSVGGKQYVAVVAGGAIGAARRRALPAVRHRGGVRLLSFDGGARGLPLAVAGRFRGCRGGASLPTGGDRLRTAQPIPKSCSKIEEMIPMEQETLEQRTAGRKKASDFPQELLDLFDDYVHGGIDRRGFLERRAEIRGRRRDRDGAVRRCSSRTMPGRVQVPTDDKRIKAESATVPSPKGNGSIKGYLVRPANATASCRRCWSSTRTAASTPISRMWRGGSRSPTTSPSRPMA